jgi:hypothetical protein
MPYGVLVHRLKKMDGVPQVTQWQIVLPATRIRSIPYCWVHTAQSRPRLSKPTEQAQLGLVCTGSQDPQISCVSPIGRWCDACLICIHYGTNTIFAGCYWWVANTYSGWTMDSLCRQLTMVPLCSVLCVWRQQYGEMHYVLWTPYAVAIDSIFILTRYLSVLWILIHVYYIINLSRHIHINRQTTNPEFPKSLINRLYKWWNIVGWCVYTLRMRNLFWTNLVGRRLD